MRVSNHSGGMAVEVSSCDQTTRWRPARFCAQKLILLTGCGSSGVSGVAASAYTSVTVGARSACQTSGGTAKISPSVSCGLVKVSALPASLVLNWLGFAE